MVPGPNVKHHSGIIVTMSSSVVVGSVVTLLSCVVGCVTLVVSAVVAGVVGGGVTVGCGVVGSGTGPKLLQPLLPDRASESNRVMLSIMLLVLFALS